MSAGGSSEMRGASLWLAAAAGFVPETKVRASNANPVVAKRAREILIPFCAIGGFLLVRGPKPCTDAALHRFCWGTRKSGCATSLRLGRNLERHGGPETLPLGRSLRRRRDHVHGLDQPRAGPAESKGSAPLGVCAHRQSRLGLVAVHG